MRLDIADVSKGLLSGILVGTGAWAFLIQGGGFIGAGLFSLGLLSIFLLNCDLYTGKIGFLKNKKKDYLKLLSILILNIIGIAILALFAVLCNPFLATAANFAVAGRLGGTFDMNLIRALINSFMCGVLIHLAVTFWKETKNLFLVILPVMAFSLCGFEHCIANIFYFIVAGSWNIFWFVPICILGNALGAIGFQKLLELREKKEKV